MRFEDLGLAEPIFRAVFAEGYTVPTPIQAKAIPLVLEGKDLFGCAQTGTGKTAAFALPILHRLMNQKPASQPQHAHPTRTERTGRDHHRPRHNPTPPRALILAPTRELASQIADSFGAYGKNAHLKHTVVFGGVSQFHQVKALQRGVDIIIATPGRLLDLMNQGHVDLRNIQILVLDEADRMLDMGFIHDIRTIVKRVPVQRQTLLFSATMPGEIRALASTILREPVSVQVNPPASTAAAIAQSVYFIPAKQKSALLAHLLKRNGMSRTLVFTRTKHGADRVVKHLMKAGLRAEAIHSNKSQNARMRALASFRSQNPPVLVATDIASRGIDVDGISHVVNFDVPHEPETYVHRIGRTARAGASGIALSFCDQNERNNLRAIERLTRSSIAVEPHVQHLPMIESVVESHGDRDRAPQQNSRPHEHGGYQGRSRGAKPHGPRGEKSHSKPGKRHHQATKQGQSNGNRDRDAIGNGRPSGFMQGGRGRGRGRGGPKRGFSA